RSKIRAILLEHDGPVAISTLEKKLKRVSLYSTLHAMQDQGVIEIERPLQRSKTIRVEQVVRLAPQLTVGSEELSELLEQLEKKAPRQANILLALVQQLQMAPLEPLPTKLL